MANIGGQAVMEGIMMMSDKKIAIAVRKKNKIITKVMRKKKKPKILNIIFIRGIANMIEMLSVGLRALNWSANASADKKEDKLGKGEIASALAIATVFAVALFIVVPFYLAKIFFSKGFAFNIVDGILRLLIFCGYLIIITRMQDMKRFFQYHGAEHKVVHCYESGKELTVKNCKKFTTLHNRCGTTFIMIALVISIIVFSFVTSDKAWVKLVSRIVLIPVIIGLSYEILKLADKFKHNFLLRTISTPGLWLQKLTTQKPDDKQIEVGIAAAKKVIK